MGRSSFSSTNSNNSSRATSVNNSGVDDSNPSLSRVTSLNGNSSSNITNSIINISIAIPAEDPDPESAQETLDLVIVAPIRIPTRPQRSTLGAVAEQGGGRERDDEEGESDEEEEEDDAKAKVTFE